MTISAITTRHVLFRFKDFTVTEVIPQVFLLNFKSQYKMTMHFLRYSEFQESPNPKFRGKSFTLLEFMEWYAKKHGKGAFTYTRDWTGYNIPGSVIEDVQCKVGVPDRNKYDEVMANVWNRCYQHCGHGRFYLIGCNGTDTKSALRHEIAHGLFCTDNEYRKEMRTLVRNLSPGLRKKMQVYLKTLGYASRVFTDETQAYLSTGLTRSAKFKANGEQKAFQRVFKEYYKKSIDSMKVAR
jgi:hypothetical protein